MTCNQPAPSNVEHDINGQALAIQDQIAELSRTKRRYLVAALSPDDFDLLMAGTSLAVIIANRPSLYAAWLT